MTGGNGYSTILIKVTMDVNRGSMLSQIDAVYVAGWFMVNPCHAQLVQEDMCSENLIRDWYCKIVYSYV